MKVMTVKLNPKTVFGLILVAAGVLVVLLTFLANHVKTGDAAPSAAEPAVLTRLRGWFNSRASIFSIRSLICVFPIPA